ncbi:MAG TPA: DNA polymerase I [Candidatus Saccharimonadales bacterium]|nr:DNA polymerase I [Candidatus Saccharimonadales bacterium]
MSERLVIIDGKSVFYRGYYAMPNLSTKDGTPTGGVYGFALMALEVIKKLKPDYVCVAWDKRGTNIRSRLALYPDYKGNRKAAPPDFYVQIPILHELLESLGWPLYEADDYEADDLMGAFAKQAGEQGVESYLVTSDLDVLQLVNKHTHIFTLKKGLSNIELFNIEHFEEKYGVGAHQWVDVKALKGDSSDNVPGVAGVGEKTALELIRKYETLDGVYEHLDELKPALKARLEKDKDMAYLSKKLVTLMVDAPVKINLEDAKLHDGFTPEFAAELRKLEFKNLLRQVESNFNKKEARAAQEAMLEAELANVPPGKKLVAAKQVPFDAKSFKPDEPRVVATNPEGSELWLSADAERYSAIHFGTLDEGVIRVLSNGPLVGHDLNPLFRALLKNGLTWPGIVGHDTRIGAFLLDSLARSRELSDLLEQPVDVTDPSQTVPAVWRAYQDQKLQLDELPKLKKLAHDIEFPTIYLLATIENRGVQLDSEYLKKMGIEFEATIKDIEQQIYKAAGKEFNIGSPMQLSNILFEELQLPTQGVKKGKTGYSTNMSELDKLRHLHPIIDLITQYREYAKLKSTYIDALPALVDEQGRLHTTYALDVAATGRLSSHDPNLQNIPIRTELGNAIRKAFIPDRGNVFVSADYSQFELRLAAVMAGDQQLVEEFNEDIDVHTATAAQVYDVPLSEVTKAMRRHAKVVNFGILYGMSPHGLSVATGMSLFEAKNFIQKYFELRAPIRTYIDQTLANALKDGYVETYFGRRRPTPDLKSSHFMVREAAKRVAANMPIQGTEADLMKIAMLEVEKNLDGKARQLLQVHDSILVECPVEQVEEVAGILKHTMEHVAPSLHIKLKVDVSSGKSWGELEPLK